MTFVPGTYYGVSTPGVGPTLIKLGTLSRIDHVGIITSAEGAVAEAEPGGVRVANISEYKGRYLLLSSPEESTAEQRQIIVDAALHMVGVPYNDLAVIDDGLEAIGAFWEWLAKMASADREIMCSQMVASCGGVAGLDWMCGRRHPSEVTPADLCRRPGMHRLTW